MQALRVETALPPNGVITLQRLPFQRGARIEIIVLARSAEAKSENAYPLRGTHIQYVDLTKSVAQQDWAAGLIPHRRFSVK